MEPQWLFVKFFVLALVKTACANGTLSLIFDPPSDVEFYWNTKTVVRYNASRSLLEYVEGRQRAGSRFFVGIVYDIKDWQLVHIARLRAQPRVLYSQPSDFNISYYLLAPLQTDGSITYAQRSWNRTLNQNAFTIEINGLGYFRVESELVEVLADNSSTVIHAQEYKLRAVRKHRQVDLGFEIAIAIISIINSFGIGCVTVIPVLRSQLKKSISICISCGTQYILLPLIVFGMCKAAKVQNEVSTGILLCCCVPGGGAGHLVVQMLETADTDLSVAINFLQLIVVLGTAPLWIISLGHFFPNGGGRVESSSVFLVLCVAFLIIPYGLGLLARHLRPSVSEAVLNWVIKPILLLDVILFITLGLYINMYMFGVLYLNALLVGVAIPFLGFIVGGTLVLITNQSKASAKTVAIESAVFNSIVVVASIRFIMPQPDADMASAAVLWVLFCTSLPFILLLIFNKVKKKIMSYFDKEDDNTDPILESVALITQNALQISGMTPEQIKERRKEELLKQRVNGDRTLLIGEESDNYLYNEDKQHCHSVMVIQDANSASVTTFHTPKVINGHYL